jgi:hypothetical protein
LIKWDEVLFFCAHYLSRPWSNTTNCYIYCCRFILENLLMLMMQSICSGFIQRYLYCNVM